MSEEEEEEAWTKKEVERWFGGGGPGGDAAASPAQDRGYGAHEAEPTDSEGVSARDRVFAAYREANPSKLGTGEVEALVARYRGQEWLLLRRVQHRYGLYAIETDVPCDVAVGPGAPWRRGTARLDARTGRVETFLSPPPSSSQTTSAAEPRVHAVDATKWRGRANDAGRMNVVAVGPDLALRFSSEKEAARWRVELGRTGAFFGRLRFEARSRAREERDRAAAVSASLAEAEAARNASGLASTHLATVEAALDDALLAATVAADADEPLVMEQQRREFQRGSNSNTRYGDPGGFEEEEADHQGVVIKPEPVFEAYLAAIDALARAKQATVARDGGRELDLDSSVLEIVDASAERCRARAEDILRAAAKDAAARHHRASRARALRAKVRHSDATMASSPGGWAPGGAAGADAAAPFLLVTGAPAQAYVTGDPPPDGDDEYLRDDDFVFDDDL